MSINMNLHCRACLSKCSRSVSIFSSPKLWGKNIVIAEMIMACAPIPITKNDGFPAKICEDCLKLLQLSFLFRLRVVASDEKIRAAAKVQSGEGAPKPLLLTSEWGGLDHVYSLDHIRRSAVSVDEDIITIPCDSPKTIPDTSVCATPNNINLTQILNPQIAGTPATNQIETAQIISSSDQNVTLIPLKSNSNTNPINMSNIVFINEQNQQLTSGSSTIIQNSSTNMYQTYQIIPLEGTENSDGAALQNLLSTEVSNTTFPIVPLSSCDKIIPTDSILQVLNVATPLADIPQTDAMGAAPQFQIENIVGGYIEPYKKIQQNPINIDLTGDEDTLKSSDDSECDKARPIEDIVIPLEDGASSSPSKRRSTEGDNDDDDEPVNKKKKKSKRNAKKLPLKIDDKLIVIDD